MKLATIARGGHSAGHSRQFSREPKVQTEVSSGFCLHSARIFPFVFFPFLFVSCFYLVLILLALFSFSDFVYFGGRARPPASFELFINSVIIKLFRAFCIFLLVYWLFIVLTTNLIILFMDLLGRYSVFYHKLLRARDGNNKWKVSNAIPSQSR